MSGICGVLRFDGDAASGRDVERQIRALAHLGPDGAHTICDGMVGLGWLHAALTREDQFEAQPLADAETGLLLVADLRLDNREELALALNFPENTLVATPDSALLLAAYLRWGDACAPRLLGDFAFAVWDTRTRRLTLGRDHMGQRHVYFHRGRDFFAFATEMKGLWALPEAPRALFEPGVADTFLRAWALRPATQTKFEGVEGLPGGTVMRIDADGRVEQHRYWTPQPAEIHLGRDEAYYREAYRAVLSEAVACRVRRATRPCGLLLSGGFDSAAIAALAAPAPGRLIAAASVLDEAQATGPRSARRWVDLCAGHIPHLDVRYVTRQGRGIFSDLGQTLLGCDGQISVNRYANSELYRTVAEAGARVVMDGYGGDYTLNPRGHFYVARLLAQGRLRRFLAELAARKRATGVSWLRCLWRDVLAAFAPPALLQALGRIRTGAPLLGGEDPVNPAFEARAAAGRSPARRWRRSLKHPRQALARALRHAQNKTNQGGILPASHGLTLTEPFHDKRVVELALAIPEDLYFKNGQDRFLARAALADLLPPEFQTRSSLNTPLVPDLVDMARENERRMRQEIARLEQNPRLTRYFDFEKMRRTLDRELGRGALKERGTGLRQAMRGLLWALHIEWFLGDNAASAPRDAG